MRRHRAFGLLVAALAFAPAAGLALSQSSIPAKFGLAWGQNAGAPYIRSIPQTSQIGIQNCAASLNDGFPPLTFTPSTAGGCPPFGQDFNGILKQLSQWAQWQSAGGPVFYDGTFATAAGGYPKGAKLASAVTAGTVFMSTVDNNTTNPDVLTGNQIVGGTGWVQDPGQVPIGTPTPSFSSAALPGYNIADSTTVGDASSNATGRANADTQFLFAFLWNDCSNTVCPLKTSGGSPVARGANAAADFAAHTAISTPLMQGSALVQVDSGGTTFLSGAPVTSGSTTTTASIVGENAHTQTLAQVPNGITSSGAALAVSTTVSTSVNVTSISVTSSASDFLEGGSVFTTNAGTNGAIGAFNANPTHAAVTSTGTGTGSGTGTGTGTTAAQAVTSNNTGGAAFNVVSRSFTVKWNLKL